MYTNVDRSQMNDRLFLVTDVDDMEDEQVA